MSYDPMLELTLKIFSIEVEFIDSVGLVLDVRQILFNYRRLQDI